MRSWLKSLCTGTSSRTSMDAARSRRRFAAWRPAASYWLRVFRLIGLACKVLELLILVLSPEPIYGPLFLEGQNDEK